MKAADPEAVALRQNGLVADFCEHGFRPDQCTICRVLRTGTAAPGQRSQATPRAAAPVGWGRQQTAVGPRADSRSTLANGVLILVGVLAIAGVVAIIAASLAAILHVLELAAVAAVAGWVGYRYGLHRGRHEPR